MGLFFRSFDRPGPGVDPNAPQKRSFFRFFDIFTRKFWHFAKVGLIYSVSLIPTAIILFFMSNIIVAKMIEGMAAGFGTEESYIVVFIGSLLFVNLYIPLWGMGPATAGMTYVMRNFAREEHAWLWSDFKDSLISNFKQAIAVFIIDLVMLTLFYMAIIVYSSMTGVMGYLKYVIYIIILVYTLMHIYIYPIMITFKLPLKDIYRNSLLLALGKLPSNLLVLAILLALHLGLPTLALLYTGEYSAVVLLVLAIIDVVVGQAFSIFLINFNAYPKMEKYLMSNEGESKDN